jgi:hypothetical protein
VKRAKSDVETRRKEFIKVESGYLVQYPKYFYSEPEAKYEFDTAEQLDRKLQQLKQEAAEIRQQKKNKKICAACPAYLLFNKPVNIYRNLTKRAKRKILNKSEVMLWATGAKKLTKNKKILYNKQNITFATLTLPEGQQHTDNEIKSACLNLLLTHLRKKYKIEYYIWKAEKTKAGNLHFHLLLDKFVHYGYLRDTWNNCINKLGYVDRYSAKFVAMDWKQYFQYWQETKYANDKRNPAQVYAAYCKGKKEGFRNPNSTDIHSMKKIKSVSRYVGKYLGEGIDGLSAEMSKEVQTDKINGKIWALSTALSKIKQTGRELCGRLQNEFSYLCNVFNEKIKYFDFSAVLLVNLETLINHKCYQLAGVYISNCKAPPE